MTARYKQFMEVEPRTMGAKRPRLLRSLATVMFVATLTACGQSSQSTPTVSSPTSQSKPPEASSESSPTVPVKNQQQQQRGCQVQGNENVVDCEVITPGAPALGKVNFVGAGVVWVFDGAPDELPPAPDYPSQEFADHCARWSGWFSEQPRMFSSTPLVSLQISAGTSELIVVRRINVVIYEERAFDPSRTYTRVECIFGGGFNPGYFAAPVIGTSQAEVSEGLQGDPAMMPPASISIRDAGEEILIAPTGPADRIYLGSIVVTVEINGVSKVIQYGDSEHPYRWTTGQLPWSTPGRAWDERDHKWKLGEEVRAGR